MAEVTFVYNMDVSGVARRLNRFISELIRSVSSGTSQVNGFDHQRALSYISATEVYIDHVVAQPQLDLPETHPRAFPVEPKVEWSINDIENESVIDLVQMLEITREEIINGQSARLPAGLISFDETRVRAVLAKANAFLTGYVSNVTPIDLPESSPMRDMVLPGRGGV